MDPASWPLTLVAAAFACVAALIGWFGIKMTRTARDLAHQTGLGEALVGALFIGASTSLSGITTSVTAASAGYAEFAVSNMRYSTRGTRSWGGSRVAQRFGWPDERRVGEWWIASSYPGAETDVAGQAGDFASTQI